MRDGYCIAHSASELKKMSLRNYRHTAYYLSDHNNYNTIWLGNWRTDTQPRPATHRRVSVYSPGWRDASRNTYVPSGVSRSFSATTSLFSSQITIHRINTIYIQVLTQHYIFPVCRDRTTSIHHSYSTTEETFVATLYVDL